MARKGSFRSFEHELARRGGVKNPDATAQTIGRAKVAEAPKSDGLVNFTGRRRNMK